MDKTRLKKYLLGDFTIRRLLRSIAFIYVTLALFAWFFSDRLIYQPPACTYEGEKGYSRIKLPNGDSITAKVWLNTDARYTVLYSHGNAVDLGLLDHHLERYRDMGFQVVSYDYPGYGTSDGRPSTSGAREAAEAAFDYVTKSLFCSPDKIIIHGRSVGSGPAIHLAKKHEVGGLIVESGFVSAFRVQTRIPVFPFDKWRNLHAISEVNCPVMIIHGKDDAIIPIWHGEKLFEEANEPKMEAWIEGMSHNSLSYEAEEAYWKAIQSLEEFVFQGHAEGLEVIGPEFCELHQQACKQEIVRVMLSYGGSYDAAYLEARRAVEGSLFPNAYSVMPFVKPGTDYVKKEGGKKYVRHYCSECRAAKLKWSLEWEERQR